MAGALYLGDGSQLQTGMGWVVAASLMFGVGGGFLKASDGFTRPAPSAAVIATFVIGAVLLSIAVRTEGLTTAYVVGLGIEAMVSIALGRWIFGEHLTRNQTLGVALILIGVASVRYG